MKNEVKKKLVNYIYVFLILLINFWLINSNINNIIYFIILLLINYKSKLFILNELKTKYLLINNIKNDLTILFVVIVLYILKINVFNIYNVLIYFILVLIINLTLRKLYFKSIKCNILVYSKQKLDINVLTKEINKININVDKIKITDNINHNKINKYDYVVCYEKDYELLYKIIGTNTDTIILYKLPVELSLLFNENYIVINDIPFLKFNKFNVSKLDLFIKRAFDIVVSFIALIILSPIILITSIIIKVTSKGSIIYKQERLTLNNKKFNIYKFRSMNNNSEENGIPVISCENDDRINKFGKFIRKFKIDEIPQFINVLKNDMSIVGPRPERPYFVEKYIQKEEKYQYRTKIKAGITGLSHTKGNYYTLPENRIIYDLMYIYNYSFINDIKILIETVFSIID